MPRLVLQFPQPLAQLPLPSPSRMLRPHRVNPRQPRQNQLLRQIGKRAIRPRHQHMTVVAPTVEYPLPSRHHREVPRPQQVQTEFPRRHPSPQYLILVQSAKVGPLVSQPRSPRGMLLLFRTINKVQPEYVFILPCNHLETVPVIG